MTTLPRIVMTGKVAVVLEMAKCCKKESKACLIITSDVQPGLMQG